MNALFSLILVALLGLAAGLAGCRKPAESNEPKPEGPPPPEDKDDGDEGVMVEEVEEDMDESSRLPEEGPLWRTTPTSREEIAKRLRMLAQSPAPTELSFGAMCYKTSMPPDRAEYVCPTCGERTLYALAEAAKEGDRPVQDRILRIIQKDLDSCRRLVKHLLPWKARLDESSLCASCTPVAKKPALALTLTFSDGTTHRVESVSSADLKLLKEFAEGSRKHYGERDSETALKDHVDRLAFLLGVNK